MNCMCVYANVIDSNTCNFCDHISPIRAEMMFHVKKVHPEHARQCTTDNCPWSDQTCWYKHVKKDHGVVAQNEYKCSVCDSTFKRNQDVMLHKKSRNLGIAEFPGWLTLHPQSPTSIRLSTSMAIKTDIP